MLTGISVRLRENVQENYSLRVLGRFAGSDAIIEAASGRDCVSPDGSPMCGLQILLTAAE